MANTFQVGSQSRVNVIRPTCPIRQVVITPLSSSGVQGQQPRIISKLLMKAVERSGTKGKKDKGKTFTLRDLNPSTLQTCTQLKTLIKVQLGADLIDEFDIGYIQGNTIVSLRSSRDIQEVWSSVLKGENITLWCDGLRKEGQSGAATKKRPNKSVQEESDDDEDSGVTKKKKKKKSKEREEQVEDTMEQLQSMHMKKYTQMQYRVWSEMYVGGIHSSLNEAPTTTMFLRAGGVALSKKKSDPVSEALTHLASAITVGPGLARSGPSSVNQAKNSPAKTIENRSRCYRQLGEIKSLHESGLLSEMEYQSEREAIMATLKNLSC